jgi:hypothetical protein
MAYVNQTKSLLIFCIDQSGGGNILKIEFIPENKPSHNVNITMSPIRDRATNLIEKSQISQKMFLKHVTGDKKPGQTLSLSKNNDSLFLNQKGETIRIFTGIDYPPAGKLFSKEIPFKPLTKFTEVIGFGEDMLIYLTMNHRVKIAKYTSFGFCEVISEESNLSDDPSDVLSSLTLCPQEKYLILLCKSQGNKQNKLVVLQIQRILTEKQGGYKIKFFKMFNTLLNLVQPTSVLFNIPFYYQNQAVLCIAEMDSTSSRVYFYLMKKNSCELMRQLGFPEKQKVVALQSMDGSLIKVNISGDLQTLRVK